MPISITALLDPRRLDTDELHRLHDALTEELRSRDELGESSLRPRHYEMLLTQLGECAQATVMREAAATHDGRVSRERVFEILGRPRSARLNGFRKPIDRAVATLVEQGDFPDVSPGPLYVDYNGGVSARTFYVAMGDLQALRAALGS